MVASQRILRGRWWHISVTFTLTSFFKFLIQTISSLLLSYRAYAIIHYTVSVVALYVTYIRFIGSSLLLAATLP